MSDKLNESIKEIFSSQEEKSNPQDHPNDLKQEENNFPNSDSNNDKGPINIISKKTSVTYKVGISIAIFFHIIHIITCSFLIASLFWGPSIALDLNNKYQWVDIEKFFKDLGLEEEGNTLVNTCRKSSLNNCVSTIDSFFVDILEDLWMITIDGGYFFWQDPTVDPSFDGVNYYISWANEQIHGIDDDPNNNGLIEIEVNSVIRKWNSDINLWVENANSNLPAGSITEPIPIEDVPNIPELDAVALILLEINAEKEWEQVNIFNPNKGLDVITYIEKIIDYLEKNLIPNYIFAQLDGLDLTVSLYISDVNQEIDKFNHGWWETYSSQTIPGDSKTIGEYISEFTQTINDVTKRLDDELSIIIDDAKTKTTEVLNDFINNFWKGDLKPKIQPYNNAIKKTTYYIQSYAPILEILVPILIPLIVFSIIYLIFHFKGKTKTKIFAVILGYLAFIIPGIILTFANYESKPKIVKEKRKKKTQDI